MRSARDEDQQRGHRHAHINEFAERCGPSHDTCVTAVPMVSNRAVAPPPSAGVHLRPSCRSVSQWCLRCGNHCALPAHVSAQEDSTASAYHTTSHTAESTAEMLRPYPLGTLPPQSTQVPDVADCSLKKTIELLNTELWTGERVQHKKRMPLSCEGSFLQRFSSQYMCTDTKQISLGDATNMRDLCVAFYYRYLQTKIVPHVCKLGYCRTSWEHACKYGLPCEDVVETMYFDEESRRTKPRKIHLDDDAYNKTTVSYTHLTLPTMRTV